MKSLVCWVCFLVGPCTWEPGQGVPGCRGGLRPFLLCSCSCLVFKRLPQEWSYLSFHLFTCTMGFAPIKWTCTALFRPRHLTDRAILANRQPQEKKNKPNSKTTKGRGPPRQPGTPRPGSQVHGPKRKTTTTNKRLHKQILVRLGTP